MLRIPPYLTTDGRRRLQRVARREAVPDVVIRGGTVANVYSGEWLPGNIEIADGWIAYVGPREPAGGNGTEVVDATGRVVVPGYIEPHAHPWVLYNPASLLEVAIPSGTTTLVFDSLFFFLQAGARGVRGMLDALADAPAHLLWVARLVSQTADPDDSTRFAPEIIEEMLGWPEMAAAGEVGRWMRVAAGENGVSKGIEIAKRLGKRVDGHTAGASYDRVVSLVLGGLSSDHEAIDAQEALTRLRLGLWTMLRGSSLRRDLRRLLDPIARGGIDTRRVMLTMDGSAPAYYAAEGMIDGLLQAAIAEGIDPMTALQMVTINPATFLGLDEELGGLAPGRHATLSILPAKDRFTPEAVLVNGRVVAGEGRLHASLPSVGWDALGFRQEFASPSSFRDPRLYMMAAGVAGSSVPVMAYESAVICRREDRVFGARDGLLVLSDHDDCVHAALIDRHRTWVSHGIAARVLPRIAGFASTYNTSPHLLVIGRDPASMAAAAQEVVRMRGGLATAENGRVTWAAPLPIAGMMTDRRYAEAQRIEEELDRIVRESGYPFHDILYTLLFFSCDFLPDLRLTPSGLLEVKSGTILQPPRALGPTASDIGSRIGN